MAMEPFPLGFGDAMDATLFSSLWPFQDDLPPQESVEELKQSLVATTLELEAAKEELKKKEQSIAKLADVVRQVVKERDQLQQHLLAASKPAPSPPPPPPPALVTSSVTDSDCSLVSSPVDPFFDPVTSSDNRCKLSSPPPAKQSANASADAVLDMLAKKRRLPQRGRLLQSVMEAGPLLQNLLVAGLLPRWRNPPTVHALDTLPVGARGGLGAPLPGANAAAALGYGAGGNACMKRPTVHALDTLPVGARRGLGAPLPGANAAAALGYGAGGNACMKRPTAAMSKPMMAMAATNFSPSPCFGAKRHRLH